MCNARDAEALSFNVCALSLKHMDMSICPRDKVGGGQTLWPILVSIIPPSAASRPGIGHLSFGDVHGRLCYAPFCKPR